MADMNDRVTLETAFNVFEHFQPHLPLAYRQTPYVLLANIHPALQSYVLDQMARPRFVVVDTMNLWITIAKEGLLKLLERTWTCSSSTTPRPRCSPGKPTSSAPPAMIRGYGPRYVAIKKGEHGCLLFGDEGKGRIFQLPGVPAGEPARPDRGGGLFRGRADRRAGEGGRGGRTRQRWSAEITWTFDALNADLDGGGQRQRGGRRAASTWIATRCVQPGVRTAESRLVRPTAAGATSTSLPRYRTPPGTAAFAGGISQF